MVRIDTYLCIVSAILCRVEASQQARIDQNTVLDSDEQVVLDYIGVYTFN